MNNSQEHARRRRIARACQKAVGILDGLVDRLERRRVRLGILENLLTITRILSAAGLYPAPGSKVPDWSGECNVRDDRAMEAALDRLVEALAELRTALPKGDDRRLYLDIATGYIWDAQDKITDCPWLELQEDSWWQFH